MYKYLFLLLLFFSVNANSQSEKTVVAGKIFKSYPVDASVTKEKFRWLAQAGAQRLVSATQITVSSFNLIYQKKRGVKVNVIVVNSNTGVKVKSTGPFEATVDHEASSWDIDYLAIKLSLTLPPGSYFIYPEVIEGKLGYLPNYNRLNRVDHKFKIYPGMFTNSKRGDVWEYSFDENDKKSETMLNDYGPFLKWELIQEFAPIGENDTAMIKSLMELVGSEGKEEGVIPDQLNKDFDEMNAEIKSSPGSRSAFNNRGAANSNIGNYSAAVRDFTVAIELDSSDVVAITNRGITYTRMGEYKLALKDFDEALFFDIKDPLIYYVKGYVERQLGKYNEAINDFNMAAVYNPRDPLTFYMRARTKMDQKNYSGALEDFEKALLRNPNYWAVFKYRAQISELQGNLDSAVADYTTAIFLNAKDTMMHVLRAEVYEKMKKDSLAAYDYQQILDFDKDNLRILQKKGEACVRAGMNEEAIVTFDHLLKLDLTFYEAYYFRGLAKFRSGDTSNACGDWTIAQHRPTEALKDAIKNHCKKYNTKLRK
ncbi:MAG: tetratricopeptide (TPR) repeat protein [Saprospiraceae bacterium]|jgi:tetratricopeptide (TPR) repeat protein